MPISSLYATMLSAVLEDPHFTESEAIHFYQQTVKSGRVRMLEEQGQKLYKGHHMYAGGHQRCTRS